MDSLKFRLQFFVVVLAVIMALGTAGFAYIEGLSFADAMYFSIVTIATVGYGDIAPVTTEGRILAVVLIILGVGTFLGVVANSTEILLNRREKLVRQQKLHMIIGVFFSELGTRLMKLFAGSDSGIWRLNEGLVITTKWQAADYSAARKLLSEHEFAVNSREADLEAIFNLLASRGDLLLRLYENPFLLEHQSFTELLRAVLHFKEELLNRERFDGLPDDDYAHLSGDIRRVYTILVSEWLFYMQYLQKNYPYLFSLAVRLNPFNKQGAVIIGG